MNSLPTKWRGQETKNICAQLSPQHEGNVGKFRFTPTNTKIIASRLLGGKDIRGLEKQSLAQP